MKTKISKKKSYSREGRTKHPSLTVLYFSPSVRYHRHHSGGVGSQQWESCTLATLQTFGIAFCSRVGICKRGRSADRK